MFGTPELFISDIWNWTKRIKMNIYIQGKNKRNGILEIYVQCTLTALFIERALFIICSSLLLSHLPMTRAGWKCTHTHITSLVSRLMKIRIGCTTMEYRAETFSRIFNSGNVCMHIIFSMKCAIEMWHSVRGIEIENIGDYLVDLVHYVCHLIYKHETVCLNKELIFRFRDQTLSDQK